MTVLLGGLLACGGQDDGGGAAVDGSPTGGNADADDPDAPDGGPTWIPEPIMIGVASGHPTFMDHPDIERFFESSSGERHFRMGHMYVPWNVAIESSIRRDELLIWLDKAAALGLEPLIAFGPELGEDNGPFSSYRPSVEEFADAFREFRALWPHVKTFQAWNEPNAPVTEVVPELAADYYLMVLDECGPDCKVAAGNFRAMTTNDFADLRMGPGGVDNPTCSASGSYIDRYKCQLDRAGGHRPAYWAFHPYLDGEYYRKFSNHCGNDDTCQTKLFVRAIGGSWSDSEVWMTEAGALYSDPHLAASAFEQACTGAFYLRLFSIPEFAGRVTRFYYFNWYGYENDMGLVDKTEAHAPRPIFDQLRDRVKMLSSSCP
jgi:hypothetical protein